MAFGDTPQISTSTYATTAVPMNMFMAQGGALGQASGGQLFDALGRRLTPVAVKIRDLKMVVVTVAEFK